MSELRVDNIVDMGGSGAPKLRKGANVTGISTITQAVVGNTTINAGGINATGIVTSSSNKFVGDLASGNITAGVMTATSSVVASNITINSGGVNASGIVSATSYQGSGANLTGIGLTIAPLAYNPDVNDGSVPFGTGIGLTFNQRVSAGVGTVTLSLTSVGSTVAEVFGLGNATSTTYTVTVSSSKFHLDGNQQYSPTLYPGNIYTFDQSAATNGTHPLRFATAADAAGSTEYTTGVETNGTPGSAGAYTRITVAADAPDTLYYYCSNHSGMGSNVSIGANVQYNNDADPPNITITPKNDLSKDTVYAISYPSGAFTQSGAGGSFVGTAYTFSSSPVNNQLWAWGNGYLGVLGVNINGQDYSSPVQIPGTNWVDICQQNTNDTTFNMALRTDGALFMWGDNQKGQLGQNNGVQYSSPIQVPGSWSKVSSGAYHAIGTKTDGTLWTWGYNGEGCLGNNQDADTEEDAYSSPVQVPGTDWTGDIGGGFQHCMAIKTNGTFWVWGRNGFGELGLSNKTQYSSPVQVPGTTWSKLSQSAWYGGSAIKTDGTLWQWGWNDTGALGQGNKTGYSSPKQVPGTNWASIEQSQKGSIATKTDGTLWSWGYNGPGVLGQNNRTEYDSPVQIPGTNWDTGTNSITMTRDTAAAIKTDGTLWTWGSNGDGALGTNQASPVKLSSPVQVPGTSWSQVKGVLLNAMTAIKEL